MKSDENFNYRLWRYDGTPGELIPLLQSAQNHFGYVPRTAIRYISSVTGIPESEVYGVITFYNQFRLRPMGRHLVRVCCGTACHVAGSRMLLDSLQAELGVETGETTEDGLFTLLTVACLGCCSLAPVIMVDEETHGRLTAASVRKIIRGMRRKESSLAGLAEGGGDRP
jgi:NADH-quinone oxidoreductase subunit E